KMPMICSSVNRFFIAVPLWSGLYTVTVLNAGGRSQEAASFRAHLEYECLTCSPPLFSSSIYRMLLAISIDPSRSERKSMPLER
ncbi:hypothetical protein, partial [Burkholderia ambifaria]|uniref:hypothetical protein n=1 Tax=Burkholderia ambifaria TaxID=152480 RepID=UPI001ABA530D